MSSFDLDILLAQTKVEQLEQSIRKTLAENLNNNEKLKEIFQQLNDYFEEIKKNESFFFEGLSRRHFTALISWSIPDENALKAIKEFVGNNKVLEVGAGFGFWSKLLQLCDCDIIPTDNFSSYGTSSEKSFTGVEKLESLDAIKFYQNSNVLIMIWPPYNTSMAYNALTNFKGNKLVFIGEDRGCNADDDFFEELEQNWIQEAIINIRQWDGIHDSLFLYNRK